MNRLHPIVGAISAQIVDQSRHGHAARRRPFVTISQAAGVGGESLAEELVQRLKQIDRADPPWTAFDKNLVEKVAADYHMSKRLIGSIEETRYNWIREMFESLSFTTTTAGPDEVIAYQRVAKTMWALAHAGRVVLVGRGGVFVTAGLSHGVHVRLIAPHDARVHRIAQERGLSEREAERELEQLDEKQSAFFERFWPGRPLDGTTFTVTYNTAYLETGRMADSIIPLMQKVQDASAQPAKPGRPLRVAMAAQP